MLVLCCAKVCAKILTYMSDRFNSLGAFGDFLASDDTELPQLFRNVDFVQLQENLTHFPPAQLAGLAIGAMVLAAKHQEQRDELSRVAIIDPLTGLRNRRGFSEAFTHHLARARRSKSALSLWMIDLDDFKLINDTHGHKLGDQALTQTAQLLQASLRSQDTAARFGGDEFAVLLEGATPEVSQEVASRLTRRIASIREADPLDVPLVANMSIGIAAVRYDMSIDEAYNLADHAMYAAKQSNETRIVVSE